MDIVAVLVPWPEGNVCTEEARYQRQPLEKMQRWWVAGLMCSGWLQAGAGLDIQYVLYHTKNSLFVPRFGQTHCACYMLDISHTHLSMSRVLPDGSFTQASRIKTRFPCAALWFFHLQKMLRFLQVEAATRM